MKANKKILSTVITIAILLFNTNLYSQLSGTYTIGAGGNYATINSAVTALVTNGVNGPVVFNIKSGSYDESLTIDSVAGTSTLNTVTFRSENGIATEVTLYSSSASLFIMKLKNADFINVYDLTFTDLHSGSTERRRILLEGYCNNVQIRGCYFTGGINDIGVSSQNASLTGLYINENNFSLKKGILMFEPVRRSTLTSIFGNSFDCVYGVSLYRHDNLSIEKNEMNVVPNAGSPNSYGVYLADCNGDLKILRNKVIRVISIVSGIVDGIKVDPYTGPGGLIANNFISIKGGTGMYIGDCEILKIYYNTIYCSAGYSGDMAIVYSHNIFLRNNMFVQLFNADLTNLTLDVHSSEINSNYNDYYYLCQHMLHFNELLYIDSLSQFQTLTGQDLNSVEREINFISPTDLHLTGASMGDENLIGTPLAEVTTDIDGQPRSPLYPYMGADEADVPLPVELISFASSVNNRNVTLKWITTSESNNSGFDIERSDVKGQTSDEWIRIGFIEGNGTSNSQHNYSYTDKNLNSGKYKYRLKQIDFNGNFTYFTLSNEVVIGVPEKYSLSQNYPNPFNPVTRLGFGISDLGFVTLKVYDILGNEIKTLVNEIKPAGYYNIEFNGSDLSSGIYFYTLKAGSFRETKRMLLVK